MRFAATSDMTLKLCGILSTLIIFAGWICRLPKAVGNRIERVGLYVGSAHPMKGFGAVVQVAKKFPQVTMFIAVRGPVPDEIEKLPNVRVFPDATYDLLPLLYNAADFSMCPSRYDPFPFVVSEALASGTPVIASPHGASLTYYTEPDLKGLLVSSTDDFEGFEQAVQLVLSDPQGWRGADPIQGAPATGRNDGPGQLVEPISSAQLACETTRISEWRKFRRDELRCDRWRHHRTENMPRC